MAAAANIFQQTLNVSVSFIEIELKFVVAAKCIPPTRTLNA